MDERKFEILHSLVPLAGVFNFSSFVDIHVWHRGFFFQVGLAGSRWAHVICIDTEPEMQPDTTGCRCNAPFDMKPLSHLCILLLEMCITLQMAR